MCDNFRSRGARISVHIFISQIKEIRVSDLLHTHKEQLNKNPRP